MKEEELIKKLKGYIYSEHGSARKFAESVGISHTYVSQMLNSEKPLTNTVLEYIGVKKVVTTKYVKI